MSIEILDSAWLIRMLKKSGATPQQRLLSLFEILADWADAPDIRESLVRQSTTMSMPEHLLAYLAEESRGCGAQLPEALAQQLFFIALSSLQESLHTKDFSNFSHAKIAAAALINAQTTHEPSPQKQKAPIILRIGIAATVTSIFIAASVLLQHTEPSYSEPAFSIAKSVASTKKVEADEPANPKATADMYAQIEQMRLGDCQFPEALQIPEIHKKIYIENVVGGQPPKNKHDQMIAEIYLAKVRCNYTPMLMKNSVN